MILQWERNQDVDELFVIQIENKFFVYCPLKHTSMQVDERAYNLILKKDKSILEQIHNRLSKKVKINIHKLNDVRIFKPSRVDIAITTKCSLSCVYCHANSNEQPRDIDIDIAKQAIDFVLQNAKELKVPYAKIGFNGGGEPTASLKLLKEIVSYARAKARDYNVPVYFGMATNAYYDENQLDFVKNNFSQLSISLDGKEEHHNLHRPTISGMPSFAKVFDNTRKLIDSGIKNINIRATVSEKTVKDLEQIIVFYKKEFPNAGYSFMPINKLGRGADCEVQPPSQSDYIDMFNEILLVKQLCPLDKVYFMCGLLSTIRSTFCDAFWGPGFNVNVDGLLSSCQRDNMPNEFYYGKISNNNGIEIDYSRFNYQKTPRIMSEIKCINCFAKYHCGGECMDLVVHNQERCEAIQRWIAYQLLDLHKK